MSEKNYDNKSWSAADIERYLSGEMPAPEMNALEKAALDDPFLQDALEGYALQDAELNRHNQAELQQRLAQRTRGKTIQSGWWKMAAAVLLLVGGVSLTYILLNKPSQQMAMRNDNTKTEEIMPGSSAKQYRELTDSVLQAAKRETARLESVAASSQKAADRGRRHDTALAYSLKANKNIPLKAESIQDTFNPARARTMQKIAEYTPGLEQVRTEPRAADAGRPTDKLNQIERLEGKLISVDTLSLAETVVSGYSRQRKKRITDTSSTKATITALDAAPVGGKAAYLKYLAENKRIAETDTALHGEVIVLFTVTPPGKLTRFKIERSLSRFYDQEAIRLIKEGPAWRTSGSKRGQVKVVVVF